MKFSQRIGVTPSIKDMQKESVDEDLKNSLWNVLDAMIDQGIQADRNYGNYNLQALELLQRRLWVQYFKKPIDIAPTGKDPVKVYLRNYFYKAEWFQIYDLIEFIINVMDSSNFALRMSEVENIFNGVLEREFSAYRLMNKKFAPITNSTELEIIAEAEELSGKFTSLKGSNIHLHAALKFLSDRQNSNYRNSIKESISAVESVTKVISGNAKDSLGGALDRIKGKLKIHPSMERGFKQLYAYTSDADGIRHAMTEESTCDFEDAKYMLVSCSAFINFLIVKADKAGISIN